MKKINLSRFLIIAIVVLIFAACKKNYIIGGKPEDVNKYSNTLTYDVLTSDPLYDTLVRLIDTAGLKDKINTDGTTLFVPTDYAVYNYLFARTLTVQNTINANSRFALDSLFYYLRNNIKGTRDSLLMYLINKPLSYGNMTITGTLYQTGFIGDTAIVSYEETLDPYLGYNPIVSNIPRVVYYTHLWKHYDLNTTTNTAGKIPANIGVHTLVKTSGIITKNGIIHVLENSHKLFFYGTKQ
jgi:hypothetical protein